MFNRILRAFRNDVTLYSELKTNPEFTSEAWIVLAISIIASAVLITLTSIGDGLSVGIVVGAISASGSVIGYFVLAGLAWFIGTKLARGTGTFTDVRVAVAYAYCLPAILTSIPVIGIIASLWLLATESSAIRETLGIGKGLTFIIVMFSIGVMLVYTLVVSGVVIAALTAGAK